MIEAIDYRVNPLLVDIEGVQFVSSPDGLISRPDLPVSPSGLGEGFSLPPDGFDGWTSGVNIRRDDTARTNQAGSYSTVGYLGTRTLILTGQAHASTSARMAYLNDLLTGLLAGGLPGLVTVTFQGREQWAYGSLTGLTKFVTRPLEPWIADFQISIWFPEPYKYGKFYTYPESDTNPTKPVDVAVLAYQEGNIPAPSIITVTGNMPRYTVEGPEGRTVAVNLAITPGHKHEIDMDTGELLVDGVPTYGVTDSFDLWFVAARGVETPQTLRAPAGGTGAMKVAVGVRSV